MIGKKLKAIRAEKNFTQEQMAEQLHMSQAAYNKYENDKSIPSADLLKRICEVFNLSANELLNILTDKITSLENSNTNSKSKKQVNNFYAIPKEQLENILQNQTLLAEILDKIIEKLK